MSGYRTWRPSCRMQTGDFLFRTRSLRRSFKLSRSGSIRHAVSIFSLYLKYLILKLSLCSTESGRGLFPAQFWPYREAIARRRRYCCGFIWSYIHFRGWYICKRSHQASERRWRVRVDVFAHHLVTEPSVAEVPNARRGSSTRGKIYQ